MKRHIALAAIMAVTILSGTVSAEEPKTPKTLKEVSESPFYLKGEAKWQIYFVERLRRYDSRLDYVEDQGPVIDGRKKEIEAATPTIAKLVAEQPKLKSSIKALKPAQKAKLEELLSKSGMTSATAFDVMVPILEALKTDVGNDKALDAPLMTPIRDRLKAIIEDAKCTQEKATKTDELTTAKVELRALKRLEKWVCPSYTIQAIEVWIADISALPREPLGDKRDSAIEFLRKASEATQPELKVLFASSALDLWPKPDSQSGSGECAGNGNTIIGKSILGNNRPSWLPATYVRLTAPMFKGSDTDRRNGMGFKVDSQGYALNLELEVAGAWRLTDSFAAIYGAGIAVGYRNTAFIDETMPKSVASTWWTFTGFGRLGLNVRDWVSGYFLAEAIAPGGYGFGGGVEVTGLPVNFGIRVLYEHTNNRTNTGAVRGSPADFSGIAVAPYAGVLF